MATSWLRRLFSRRPRLTRKPRSRWNPPAFRLEPLEDRLTPAFNLTVGGAVTQGVETDTMTMPGTTIFRAIADDASVSDEDFIDTSLPLLFTSASGGSQEGNITVNNPLFSLGVFTKTVTFRTDASATQGDILVQALANGPNATHNYTFDAKRDIVLNDGGEFGAAGTLNLTAGEAITQSTDTLDAGSIVMQAGTGIGTADAPIVTNVSSLKATTGTGGVFVSNTGDLTLEGIEVTTSGNISIVNVGTVSNGSLVSTVGVSTLSGDITIAANAMAISKQINASTGVVTLKPVTDDWAIDLGSTTDTATDTLELSDDELDLVTDSTIVIGGTAAGAITISAALSQAEDLTLITSAGVSGSADITNGSGNAVTLTIDQASDSVYAGVLGGPAGGTADDKNLALVKRGTGALRLNGTNTYTGTTTVEGGILGGSGTIPGATTVRSGATLAPGNSPGILNVTDMTFEAGSTFEVEIEGATAGAEYDQLVASGTVIIESGALIDLRILDGLDPAPFTVFRIIDKTSADPIDGAFDNLADGEVVTIDGVSFRADYQGGDGNDLTLTVLPTTVYVNDNWVETTDGADADSLGVLTDAIYHVTAFDSVREALDVVAPGGTVYILGGMYSESDLDLDQDATFTLIPDTVQATEITVTINFPVRLFFDTTVILLSDFFGLGPVNLVTTTNGTINSTSLFGDERDLSIVTTAGEGDVTLNGAIGNLKKLDELTLGESCGCGFDRLGNLAITANVNTVDEINIDVNNAVSLGGAVDSGDEEITILVNQDGGGTQGFTQTATSSITTTEDDNAILIEVLGEGSADVAAISAVNGYVGIFVLGAITDANAAVTNVTAVGLDAAAGTGIGTAANALETEIANLSVLAGTVGIFITNTGDLSIGSDCGCGPGVVVEDSGDVVLINTGSISILFEGQTIYAPGAVTVRALGAKSDIVASGRNDSDDFFGAIQSEAGPLIVHADRDVIIGTEDDGFGDVISEDGAVTITAGGDIFVLDSIVGNYSETEMFTTMAGGAITLIDSLFNTAGGDQSHTATTGAFTIDGNFDDIDAINSTDDELLGGDIDITGVGIELGGLINAGPGTVTLDATTGGISDEIFGVNIIADAVAMTATTGIGVANDDDIDLQTSRLEANTVAGGIFIDNEGDLAIGGVTASLVGVVALSGDIDLEVVGSISVVLLGEIIGTSGSVWIEAEGTGANVILGGGNAATSVSPTTFAAIQTGGAIDIYAENDVLAGTAAEGRGDIFSYFDAVSVTAGRDIRLRGSLVGTGEATATGIVTLDATTGGISSQLADAVVVGFGLAMTASTGIGVGDNLATRVSHLEAKTTTGGIFVRNAGALTIGGATADLVGLQVVSSGDIDVSTASPMTVTENVVTVADNITLATDDIGPGDDLMVNAGVQVKTGGGNITLKAGDNLTIQATALVQTSGAGTILLEVDAGNADPGTGGTASVVGAALDAPAGATVMGNGDDDVFNLSPSPTTPITVNGSVPTTPTGDTLNLDLAGFTGQTLQITERYTATASFAGTTKAVKIISIETTNVSNGKFDVLLDLSQATLDTTAFGNGSANPDAVRLSLDATGTKLLFDVAQNGGALTDYYSLNLAGARSASLAGSSDRTAFQLAQTAGGLPTFSGNAIGSHNDAGLLPPGTFTEANVGLNVKGSGRDTLSVVLTTARNVSYFADLTGGNTEVQNVVRASFEDLAEVAFTGAGASLLTDATLVFATALTVGDDGAANGLSQISGNGGFTTARFGGFAQMSARGGTGSQTMALNALDALDAALASLVLSGDNAFGTDPAGDTLNVNALVGTRTARLIGAAGNDTFNVVPGRISVKGGTGANRLVVNTSGSAAPQAIVLTNNRVMGGGNLDVTYDAVGGNYSRDVQLTTGAGADAVRVISVAGPTGVSTGGGNDAVTVAGPARLRALLPFPVTVNAGTGVNALSISDAASPTPDVYYVNRAAIAGTDWRVNYLASGGSFGLLTFTASQSGDIVRVVSKTGTRVVVNAAGGNDALQVFVSRASLPAGLEVDGGRGVNTLQTIDNSGGAVIRNFPSGPRSGRILVSYTGLRTSSYLYRNINQMVNLNVNSNYVQALYRHIIGRTATPAEVASALQVLTTQGRLPLVVALEHSAAGRTFLVRRWYLMFFGRTPTAAESNPLVQRLLAGQSEEVVLGVLLGSPSLPNSADFRTRMVRSYYLDLFRRNPTPAELSLWVDSTQSLERIREQLEVSEPFYLFGV